MIKVFGAAKKQKRRYFLVTAFNIMQISNVLSKKVYTQYPLQPHKLIGALY
jgi:hypothetical protein